MVPNNVKISLLISDENFTYWFCEDSFVNFKLRLSFSTSVINLDKILYVGTKASLIETNFSGLKQLNFIKYTKLLLNKKKPKIK